MAMGEWADAKKDPTISLEKRTNVPPKGQDQVKFSIDKKLKISNLSCKKSNYTGTVLKA